MVIVIFCIYKCYVISLSHMLVSDTVSRFTVTFFFTSDCRQVISTIVVGLKKNFAYHTIWVMSLNQFIVTLLLLPVTDLCSFSCYSIIG